MMFSELVCGESADGELFRLVEKLVAKVPTGRRQWYSCVVPINFKTDKASFSIGSLKLGKRWDAPGVLHDYLYYRTNISRRECDYIFRCALKENGVSLVGRWFGWAFVRTVGWRSYGKNTWNNTV